jgi:Uma2 family endonuclease
MEMVEYTHAESPISMANETAVKYGTKKHWTFDEYIAAEEFSDEKHEFHDGKRITMAGSTRPHALININIGSEILKALNDKNDEDTEVYSNDMKVFIAAVNRSVYPDVIVATEKPIMKHKHVMTNPTLIVEVLSNSTKEYDKGKKFDNYKTISSFREYVLVSQNEPIIEVFFRENADDTNWQCTRVEGLEASFYLMSIGCTLKMKNIYRRVFK